MLPGETAVNRTETGASGPLDSRDGAGASTVPVWFERVLAVVVCGVVSFGAIGLLYAVVGAYHAAIVFVLSTLATVALGFLAWPRRRGTRPGLAVTLPAIGMCLVVVGFFGWNARLSGHHVEIGRDPGVYTAAGKWIADHGNLEVPVPAQWRGEPGVATVSPGMYTVVGNRLQFQFDHMVPVLFAEADNLGGDRLMFRVPVFLASFGLAAIYLVGCRLTRRPWMSLVAATALAVSLPQLNVARETLTESAVQLLLWSAVWLLASAYERGSGRVAFVGGLTAGSLMLCHIDAPLYLLALPILAALTWISAAPGQQRRRLTGIFGGFLVGVVPVVALAVYDLTHRSGHYYDDLHTQVHQLYEAAGASLIAGFVIIAVWPAVGPRLERLGRWANSRRTALATTAGVIAGAVLLGAWAVRPLVQQTREGNTPGVLAFVGGLQRAAGLAYDPTRTYGERSIVWISWYLGPITVALAVVGLGVLVARVCRRPDPTGALVLTMVVAGTAWYLWKPSIAPDQIWAMRRFVPAALPLFAVLAALALSAMVSWVAKRVSPGWSVPLAAAGAVGMIAFPLATTWPVRNFEPQSGVLPALDATCKAVGPRAAILIPAGDPLAQDLPPALRDWCGVPVALLTRQITPGELSHLSDVWSSAGRTLWVVGGSPGSVGSVVPGGGSRLVAAARDGRELEIVLNHPPRRYGTPGNLTVYAEKAGP